MAAPIHPSQRALTTYQPHPLDMKADEYRHAYGYLMLQKDRSTESGFSFLEWLFADRSNSDAEPYNNVMYRDIRKPICMAAAYFAQRGENLDLAKPEHERQLQLAIIIDKVGEGNPLPQHLQEYKMQAVELWSAYQQSENHIATVINPAITTIQIANDIAGIFTGPVEAIMCSIDNINLERQRIPHQEIQPETLQNYLTEDDLKNPDIVKRLQSLNLSPKAEILLLKCASADCDSENTPSSNVPSLYVDAGILAELNQVMEQFKTMCQNDASLNTCIDDDIQKLTKELQPLAQLMEDLAKHQKEKKEAAESNQMTQQIQAVAQIANMISVYNRYRVTHDRDQQTLNTQRQYLKDAIDAESLRLRLGSFDLDRYARMDLPTIETALASCITYEYASNFLINRDKNFRLYMENFNTNRERMAKESQTHDKLEEKINATAQASAQAASNCDKDIKRAQRGLRYAGRRLAAIHAIRAGAGLFSLYSPAVSAGISAVLELASIPFQGSYERRLRRCNTLIDRGRRITNTYQQAGAIYEDAAALNQNALHVHKQQEVNRFYDAVNHPELFNPDDFQDILKEQLKVEADDKERLKSKLTEVEGKLEQAESNKKHWERESGGKFSKEWVAHAKAQLAKEEAICSNLELRKEFIKEDIKDIERNEKEIKEKLEQAEKVAPLQKYFFEVCSKYIGMDSKLSDDEKTNLDLCRKGHRGAMEAIQAQAAPYRNLLGGLNQLVFLCNGLIQEYDPGNKLRIPQTINVGAQALEFGAAANMALEGVGTLKEYLSKCTNLSDCMKILHFRDLLDWVANPIVGLINQGIRLGVAGNAVYNNRTIEDPQTTLIKSLHKQICELIIEVSKNDMKKLHDIEQQNKDQKELATRTRDDVHHVFEETHYIIKVQIDRANVEEYNGHLSRIMTKAKEYLLTRLTTAELEKFNQSLSHLSEDDLNPINAKTNYISMAPACFTNSLNEMLGNKERLPNLWLFISKAHLFVQTIISSKNWREKNKLKAAVGGISQKLLTLAKKETALLASVVPFYEIMKSGYRDLIRDTVDKISEANQVHVAHVNGIVKEQIANQFATAKSAADHLYVANLCYMLTCAKLNIPKEYPKHVGAGGGTAFALHVAGMAASLGAGLKAGAMAFVAAAPTGLAAIPIAGIAATAGIYGGITAQEGSTKILALWNSDRVIRVIRSYEGMTAQSLILSEKKSFFDKGVEVLKTTFRNQHQKTLKGDSWKDTTDSIFDPAYATAFGDRDSGRLLVDITLNPKPDPLKGIFEVVISSNFITPQLHYSSTAIDQHEVKMIPPMSETDRNYDIKINKLLSLYDTFLEGERNGTLSDNDSIKKQLGEYRMLPGQNGMRSLAVPKEFLDDLEVFILVANFLGIDAGKPYYDFFYNEKSGRYDLQIDFKRENSDGTLGASTYSPIVASVDKATVEYYKKILLGTNESKLQTQLDLKDVVIILVYTSFIEGLNLPSKDAFVLKSGLIVSSLIAFEGFYKIWQANPRSIIHFNSAVHEQNASHLGADIYMYPTQEATSVDLEIELKMKEWKQKTAFTAYRTCYHSFRAYCKLISNKTQREIEELMLTHLNLFDPDNNNMLEMLLIMSMRGEVNPTLFFAELLKKPSEYTKHLNRIQGELRFINKAFKTNNLSLLDKIPKVDKIMRVEELELLSSAYI